MKVALLSLSLIFTLTSCAYYNYLYNAKQSYAEGEEKRREQIDEPQSGKKKKAPKEFQNVIESAGRMLDFYPDSKWEEEALFLLAKAYYRTGKFRNSIGKVDELLGKYPDTFFTNEAILWKGMSLFHVVQPDSARQLLTGLIMPDITPDIQAQAFMAMADYYFENEKWSPAILDYRKALESGTDDEWLKGQALIKVGDCMKQLGLKEEALDLYEDVLSTRQSSAFRFKAVFQLAKVKADLGRYEDAFKDFKSLLRKGAFLDEFPRVELEMARCEINLGEYENAHDRLEKLIEAKSRGPVAAEAQYELGMIHWFQKRDLKSAIIAFNEVKTAERSSPQAEPADSMAARIEKLSRYWMSLKHFRHQQTRIDSVKMNLAEIFPNDTTFVDSIEIMLNEGKKERKSRKDFKSRDDPMLRMIEEAKKAEAEENARLMDLDTLEVAESDSVKSLDSTAIAEFEISLKMRERQVLSELGNFYFFIPSERDSSISYFQMISKMEPFDDVWGSAVTSLAYFEKLLGDTASYDSLLNVIIGNLSDGSSFEKANRALGLTDDEIEIDSLEIQYQEAEDFWFATNNPVAARERYLNVANSTDSTSTVRARALLAAAYLSVFKIGEDTIAGDFYKIVMEEYPKTDYARSAREIHNRFGEPGDQPFGEEEEGLNDKSKPPPVDPYFEEDEFGGSGIYDRFEIDPDLDDEEVFEPDRVDELPDLITSPNTIRNLTRSNYPFEAMSDNIRAIVELEFVVGARGEIRDIEVVSENPEEKGFGKAAMIVLMELEYEPGWYRGRQVAIKIKQEIIFDSI
ncbi:MAG: tetratricopeptide repeat protein [Calditrichaeota bacterium]|nr:tetratricopeptide repeat protein [Calditrichota bacterium]MBT7616390.1 tetratricopeptide repeat protein [Calditrichota bacterium]